MYRIIEINLYLEAIYFTAKISYRQAAKELNAPTRKVNM